MNILNSLLNGGIAQMNLQKMDEMEKESKTTANIGNRCASPKKHK